jgi:hypothetical protein
MVKAWETLTELKKEAQKLVSSGKATKEEVDAILGPFLEWEKELAPTLKQAKEAVENAE